MGPGGVVELTTVADPGQPAPEPLHAAQASASKILKIKVFARNIEIPIWNMQRPRSRITLVVHRVIEPPSMLAS